MSHFSHEADRRAFLRRVSGTALAGVAGLPLAAQAQSPALPTSPVSINVMDVGGALALTQPAFEDYKATHEKLVSRIGFIKAPAPELAGKLKAQQAAGRLDIDLVLTGSDGLAAGLEQDLWLKILPDHNARFPNLEANYDPAPLRLHKVQGQGYGVLCNFYPSGPLIEYAPERVKNVPTTAEELLAWAKANPKRFMYARPANSGPVRTFMMGLPYLLKDKDPKDPVQGWQKTWAYLQELGNYIEYYPTGTGATMKEFGEGSRDMIVSTTGWDINPRALGIVPKSAAIGTLKGFHWVSDGFFMCIPKGIPNDRLAVTLDIMGHILKPEMQAISYDEGYLYPGPAVKNVPLSLAPKRSQEVIRDFGRPEYARLIADNPIELPLDTTRMVVAFRMWDQLVGAKRAR